MAELSDTILLGEWLPDRAAIDSGGCVTARNCIPYGPDYRPFKSIIGVTSDLASQCYGGYSHIASDGTVTTFVATRTKIYKLNGSSFTDVTNTGGDYTTPEDGRWFFDTVGDRIIATNYVNNIQTFVVGVSSNFADLITSGPNVKCRNFGVINNFLVCVDIDDDEGTSPNKVRWSPINDPAGDWTPSQTTQADYQYCEDGNPGQGMAVISGQNFGTILFKNAIYRMEYVGPPNVFVFSLVEHGRGPVNGQSVAWNGSDAFYKSEQGFFQFNGNFSRPIGDMKVDRYFDDSVENNRLYNNCAMADPINKNILLAYTSTGSPNGRNDRILCYNWPSQRFTEIDIACDIIFKAFTSGFTLEDIGAAYPSIETVPYSFDSTYWAGGNTVLAGIYSDALGYFQGEPMTAYIESQETRLNNDGIAYLESVLPVFKSGTCTVRIGSRKNLNDTVLYTDYQSPNSETGECNFENENRYYRAGVSLSGPWEILQGIKYRAGPAGGV